MHFPFLSIYLQFSKLLMTLASKVEDVHGPTQGIQSPDESAKPGLHS